MRKILDLDLKVDYEFGLYTLNFTGFVLEIFWTAIYNQILYWHWTLKYLDYEFGLTLLYFVGFEL